MNNNKKKVIIFGSAFNPPHFGHAAILKAALKGFECDEVWIMPTGDRFDKNLSVDADTRVAMAELWAEELFGDCLKPVIVSRMEADRGKPTLTHDTHQELTNKYPDDEFYFLVGGDNLADIRAKWHKGDELYENLNFIIVGRPGYDLPADLPKHSLVLETSGSNISSTKVRAAIEEEEEIEDFVPESVAEYIRENKLYQPKYD